MREQEVGGTGAVTHDATGVTCRAWASDRGGVGARDRGGRRATVKTGGVWALTGECPIGATRGEWAWPEGRDGLGSRDGRGRAM